MSGSGKLVDLLDLLYLSVRVSSSCAGSAGPVSWDPGSAMAVQQYSREEIATHLMNGQHDQVRGLLLMCLLGERRILVVRVTHIWPTSYETSIIAHSFPYMVQCDLVFYIWYNVT